MRELKVCPSCNSPYLATEVLTDAVVNRSHQWELDYVYPEDLREGIESTAGTLINCQDCEWSGAYGELISTPVGHDGIQFDSRMVDDEVELTALPTCTLWPNSDSTKGAMPELYVGDVLEHISGETHVIITKNIVSCMYVDPNTAQTTKGVVALFTLLDPTTNQLSVLRGNDAANSYRHGELTIIHRKPKEVEVDPEDAQDEDVPKDLNDLDPTGLVAFGR